MSTDYDMRTPVFVQLLGDFLLSRDGRTVASSNSRMKKVWILIAYLILNRNRTSSQDELAKVLWNGSKCGDANNALKNLIYRSRNLLKTLSDGEEEYILFSDGGYRWNPDISCCVDCEKLEESFRYVQNSEMSAQEKLCSLRIALQNYQGSFLSQLQYSTWVQQENSHYFSVYEKCLLQLIDLLHEKDQLQEIIELAEQAAERTPLTVSFQVVLIREYLNSGNYVKALDTYNRAADLFSRNAGNIPKELQSIYQEMLHQVHTPDFDLSLIKEELREADTLVGAFFCNYETFKNIYRLQARILLREGRRIYVALASLVGMDGSALPEHLRKEAMEAFQETLIVGLRKGDVVSAYSPSQFVMLLLLSDMSDGKQVLNRLKENYFANYPGLAVKIDTHLSMVDPASKEG